MYSRRYMLFGLFSTGEEDRSRKYQEMRKYKNKKVMHPTQVRFLLIATIQLLIILAMSHSRNLPKLGISHLLLVHFHLHEPTFIKGDANIDAERIVGDKAVGFGAHPLPADVKHRPVVPFVDYWQGYAGT